MPDTSLSTVTFCRPLQPFRADVFLERLNAHKPIDDRLRRWVDEWIETGRIPAGMEDPQSRTLDRATSLSLALLDFSEKHMRLMPAGTTLVPHFDSWEVGKTTAGYPVEMVAQATFFMLSPLRFHIAKCAGADCGEYFTLAKSRCVYKRGTFCRTCQTAERRKSSGSLIARQRQSAANLLYSAICRKFRQSIENNPETWHTDPKLRLKVVEFLNQVIGRSRTLSSVYKVTLTSKWLNAKNRQAIMSGMNMSSC